MRVTILTNGPGELWGWARPVARELRRRGHDLSLWLLRCPFASGHEREAASLLGVDKLEGPAGTRRLWHRMAEERTDCVIQLGGDLIFGARMARAARAPLICYTYGPKKGLRRAEHILTAYPQQALPIKGARPIGDLVKDALLLDVQAPQTDWDWPAGSPRVLFLPGSRPAIRRAALPWLSALVPDLRAGGVRFRTLFPPFVPASELGPWRDAGLEPFRAPAGLAMREADFALTQPGTNTLELMHCGLPGLVAAPSSFFELIPLSGLKGVLASLPLLGGALRRRALERLLRRWNGTISLPNRIFGRDVLQEAYGDLTPQEVARRVLEAVADSEGLARARRELLALSGEPGAAGRLCDLLPAAGAE